MKTTTTNGRTSRAIALDIRANVDALYARKITLDAFKSRNRGLWDEAASRPRIKALVLDFVTGRKAL